VVGAVGFAIFGPVHWGAAAVIAVGALAGGHTGAGLARRVTPEVLRWAIVSYGTIAAIVLLV
jgi:uncharacterized membrane protein YfcA